MKDANITLKDLANGALEERFQDAFRAVLRNIQDVNTEAKEKREITLKMTLIPGADRSLAAVKLEVVTKTAHPKEVETTIFMGFQGTDIVVSEHIEEQPSLPKIAPVRSAETQMGH